MKRVLLAACVLFYGSYALAETLLIVQEDRSFKKILAGFLEGYTETYETYYSIGKTGTKIVAAINTLQPEIVLTIGPAALAKVAQTKTSIPIVYVAVANTAPYDGRKNITGVHLNISPVEQLRVYQKTIPSIRRIGVICSPRSAHLIKKARGITGIELISIEIDNAKEMVPALSTVFLGIDENGIRKPELQIDAFWMVPDATIYYPEMNKHMFTLSFVNKIPILTFSPRMRDYGAVVSLEVDPFEIGRQAQEMITAILNGEEWPAPQVAAYEVEINHVVAEKMGFNLGVHYVNKSRIVSQANGVSK